MAYLLFLVSGLLLFWLPFAPSPMVGLMGMAKVHLGP
jgi:hypothetical protein